MIPLLAIGAAISAASSIANGVAWVSHQFSDAKPDPPGNPEKPAAAAKAEFAASLPAQTAGQKLPPVVHPPTPGGPLGGAPLGGAPLGGAPLGGATAIAALAGAAPTPADFQARIQAGLSAYRHLGEHRPAAA